MFWPSHRLQRTSQSPATSAAFCFVTPAGPYKPTIRCAVRVEPRAVQSVHLPLVWEVASIQPSPRAQVIQYAGGDEDVGVGVGVGGLGVGCACQDEKWLEKYCVNGCV